MLHLLVDSAENQPAATGYEFPAGILFPAVAGRKSREGFCC